MQPGKLTAMLAGRTPLGPVTPGLLLGFAIFMSVPAVMVFFSAALPARTNRWTNLILGGVYTFAILSHDAGGLELLSVFGCGGGPAHRDNRVAGLDLAEDPTSVIPQVVPQSSLGVEPVMASRRIADLGPDRRLADVPLWGDHRGGSRPVGRRRAGEAPRKPRS
jgi:hypothetical protein